MVSPETKSDGAVVCFWEERFGRSAVLWESKVTLCGDEPQSQSFMAIALHDLSSVNTLSNTSEDDSAVIEGGTINK